jgi:hypothetical protein
MGKIDQIVIQIGPPDRVSVQKSVRTVVAGYRVEGEPKIRISLDGFDGDPRDLWDIPAARRYVNQAVTGLFVEDSDGWSRALARLDTGSATWIGLCTSIAERVPGGIRLKG